jgi:hypothetical protein
VDRIPPDSILACQLKLRSLAWKVIRERSELTDGGIVWMLTCSKDGDEFIARGRSPQEVWLNATQRVIELSQAGGPPSSVG